MREIYQDYSNIVIKLDDREETTVTLKLWKAFESTKHGDITIYSFRKDYENTDYNKFISYLKIDTTEDKRYGETISEEEMNNCFGDIYSIYKFHYITKTAEGDILNIIPFEPIDFYLKE